MIYIKFITYYVGNNQQIEVIIIETNYDKLREIIKEAIEDSFINMSINISKSKPNIRESITTNSNELNSLGSYNKLTLTIAEAAELTGIGKGKLMELAHSKNSDFPVFRVGSKFLINRDKLIEWLNKLSIERRIL
ncbi:hypothetical protein CFB3_18840 [Clostridium folliculivorans]|uniref:Helix-turn-helix domain-containing protein n=2 Tax=Clostridium folliculivorans TaxID=2886038 RepID=A0A9W5XZ20_9CLOT|nr:hypothetical protein CFOLD11_04870 [Clostridium folliculivorans]GKU29777.1 hypothetical protein CFB3_18840 [Clostridium folliculivorans]